MSAKLIVVALAAACALFVSAPALGHGGSWWWTQAGTTATVTGSSLAYSDDETGDEWEENIEYAKCYGRGTKWRKNYRTYFKHFECYVETDYDPDAYWIYVHVTGRSRFVYDFIEYDYERGSG